MNCRDGRYNSRHEPLAGRDFGLSSLSRLHVTLLCYVVMQTYNLHKFLSSTVLKISDLSHWNNQQWKRTRFAVREARIHEDGSHRAQKTWTEFILSLYRPRPVKYTYIHTHTHVCVKMHVFASILVNSNLVLKGKLHLGKQIFFLFKTWLFCSSGTLLPLLEQSSLIITPEWEYSS